MIARRLLLGAPLALAACGGRELPPLPPRLVEGYAYLTPLRLNVAEVQVSENPAGLRADPPAPILPAAEVARMGRDRLLASGTTNRARFVVETATLTRSGDAIAVQLRARVEVLDGDRPVAFAEAEARRAVTGTGSGAAARSRAAEEIMIRAMEDLNVEFELQVRRNLRDWLLETTPTAPVAPLGGPEGIDRQDIPQPPGPAAGRPGRASETATAETAGRAAALSGLLSPLKEPAVTRFAALIPALALSAGLAACAEVPAAPYYTVPPPSVSAVPPSYRNSDLARSPAYGAPGVAQGVPASAVVDPYCREAFANAVGTQQAAATSGAYSDAARAERSANFFRRDC